VKKTADDSRHEKDRDEYCHQGERDRHDGKPHLLGANDRRLKRVHAILDVAHDVLKHHDSVVDHQPDRERDAEQ